MDEQTDGIITQLHKLIHLFLDDLSTYQQQMRETGKHLEELEREAQATAMPRVETALRDAAARIRAAGQALEEAQRNITPLLEDNPPPKWK